MNLSDNLLGKHGCGIIRRHRGFTIIEHLRPVLTEAQLNARAAYKRRKWAAETDDVAA